jgi:DNA-binding CsgD family transcriptional regulator
MVWGRSQEKNMYEYKPPNADAFNAAGSPAGFGHAGEAAATAWGSAPAANAAQAAPLWLLRAFDEIDYGVVLVRAGRVCYCNDSAIAELDSTHPLQLLAGVLKPRRHEDAAAWQAALLGAARGLRRLLSLGAPGHRVGVAVLPLPDAMGDALPFAGAIPASSAHQPPATESCMLLLGKRKVCEPLSLQWFARSHGLTPAETRVLESLCQGLQPREVARSFGVGISTVRTQICSLRAKTGSDSVRELVQQVAVLPPMRPALRTAA